MQASHKPLQFRTIEFNKTTNTITILDQTKLPEHETYIALKNVTDVYTAIKTMQVRGAPLIGVTAAYGCVLAAKTHKREDIKKAASYLLSARPTAINLTWAITRMVNRASQSDDLYKDLMDEAEQIRQNDVVSCQKMGEYGATLIHDAVHVMVHCNAGALATSGIGTALGVLYTAQAQGKQCTVYSCETRPLLQGARLTTWELTRNGIETYVICDSMAATYMPDMDLVLVGADRIAANGDTANKIGTRGIAIVAQYYAVPFYVVAPVSTFDRACASGEGIPIETRCEDEIRRFNTRNIVAEHAKVCNPAFDVTPADLITAIVTEKGILHPPFKTAIAKLRDSVK
jgi:methylthioribose-1-phosphate isomerase